MAAFPRHRWGTAFSCRLGAAQPAEGTQRVLRRGRSCGFGAESQAAGPRVCRGRGGPGGGVPGPQRQALLPHAFDPGTWQGWRLWRKEAPEGRLSKSLCRGKHGKARNLPGWGGRPRGMVTPHGAPPPPEGRAQSMAPLWAWTCFPNPRTRSRFSPPGFPQAGPLAVAPTFPGQHTSSRALARRCLSATWALLSHLLTRAFKGATLGGRPASMPAASALTHVHGAASLPGGLCSSAALDSPSRTTRTERDSCSTWSGPWCTCRGGWAASPPPPGRPLPQGQPRSHRPGHVLHPGPGKRREHAWWLVRARALRSGDQGRPAVSAGIYGPEASCPCPSAQEAGAGLMRP